MIETKYTEIKEKQPKFPVRDLVKITGERNLVASLNAFGPASYGNNIEQMQESYSHPDTRKRISFRPATSAESILIADNHFKNKAKPKIFNSSRLQLSYIVKAQEGFFANPPKDEHSITEITETEITDYDILKKYLKKCKKFNRIWLYQGNDPELIDFGYADYETFKQGYQDSNTFARTGLARLLEYTKEPIARHFTHISSNGFYPGGVRVIGFDPAKTPGLWVVSLCSYRGLGGSSLGVFSLGWYVIGGGCAFGVLKSGEASAQKNK